MKLMHCPFCGEESALSVQNKAPHSAAAGLGWRTYTYYIICRCNACGPHVESVHLDVARNGAVDSWNTRIPHDEDLALRTAFSLAS